MGSGPHRLRTALGDQCLTYVGIMVCLMGVFMVAAAFKEAWRVPILLCGMIEKAFMVFLVATNLGQTFSSGFLAPAVMDAIITAWSVLYFVSLRQNRLT